MPLAKGSSKEVISKNIAELVSTGKYSQSQAAAIAYSEARKSSGVDRAFDDKEDHGRDLKPEPDSKVVAFIVYTDGDRILWLHRTKDGSWGFPGGHVEEGESPIEGAIRESREEILHVPAAGLTLIHQDGNVYLYACNDGEFTPELNEEHSEFVWATMEDAPDPLFPKIEEDMEEIAQEAEKVAEAMDRREIDPNGWIIRTDNPISKVGVYPYSGRFISPECVPDQIYYVLRPEEELADPETLKSAQLIPWIDNHVMLGNEEDGLTPPEQKGIQGVTGEQVYYETPYIKANLKLMSQAMAELIDSGKRELSAGYRCRYEKNSGIYNGMPYDYVQRDIRFNHLALVSQGRMGPDVAVLDESETLKGEEMADESKSEKTEKPEEKKAEDTKPNLEEIKAFLEAHAPMIRECAALLSGSTEGEQEVTDSDDEKPKEGDEDKPKGEDSKAMDAAEIERRIEEKYELYALASPVVGAFDHKEMTSAKMAKYLAEKLELDIPKEGRVAAVKAHLKTLKPATHAMDSKSTQSGSFVDAYLKG